MIFRWFSKTALYILIEFRFQPTAPMSRLNCWHQNLRRPFTSTPPSRPFDFNTKSEESLTRIFDLLDTREEFASPSGTFCDTFDVEYTQGVLTIKFDPKTVYVLNKQPPNQQIWLSSPFSGPRRFEWRHETENWCDVRDKDVELNEFLRKELLTHLDIKV